MDIAQAWAGKPSLLGAVVGGQRPAAVGTGGRACMKSGNLLVIRWSRSGYSIGGGVILEDVMAIPISGWRMTWKGWRLQQGGPLGGDLDLNSVERGQTSDLFRGRCVGT